MLLLAVVGLSVAGMPRAQAVTIAGVCTMMNVTADYEQDLTPTSVSSRVEFNGTGQCVTSSGMEMGTLDGSARPLLPALPGFSCAGGVGIGSGSFTIEGNVFPGTVEVTIVAGVVDLLFVPSPMPFHGIVGDGGFLQNPNHTADCALNGLATTTWSGVFAFGVNDPVPGTTQTTD